MGAYITRRILLAIPVFFGITILVFVFVALAPGDPVSAYIRPEVAGSQELRDALTRQLGLDQPIPIRYLRWLSQTVQGNLGYSAISGVAVNGLVQTSVLASVILVGTALVIGVAIGVPLGMLSALRQYSRLDFLLTTVAFLGISTPSFVLGLGSLYIFGLVLGLFPIGGMLTPAQPFSLLDFLEHLALPALVLAVGYVASLMRYTRAAMLDVVSAAYMTTAVSKGLPPESVVVRHGFRNALIPVVTVVGLSLSDLFGAAIITETVFQWPGMGYNMVSAVTARDFPVIMGLSLVVAIGVLTANLLTDVTYAVVDPRIRY